MRLLEFGTRISQWSRSSSSVWQFSSVAQSCLTLCDAMNRKHARPPCPSPTPGVYPNPCPSSRWCHPAISSSVVPFSSCLQSFPASGSFPMSQFFAWGGQSIGVSASISVLPMHTSICMIEGPQRAPCKAGDMTAWLGDLPMVKNPPSNAGGVGSRPCWGTKIPHAAGQVSSWV